ncbi:MAG TPA: hotdog fold thioesterase [Anaeromyxobacter sp.]|nr:hotdog fold thioesterase [Anaeromyxobacter sp.]
MADVRIMLAQDRFAAHAGITLEHVEPGRARARLEIGPQHLNGVGIAQGGAIFTLADFAFAAAANSSGSVAVAIEVSISFVRAVRGGVLVAEASEEAATGRIGTSLVRVTDGEGALVAIFKGTAFRRREGETAA